jgi:hypothetical protein
VVGVETCHGHDGDSNCNKLFQPARHCISVDCGTALMVTLKSSKLASIGILMTSMVDLTIDLNGSFVSKT